MSVPVALVLRALGLGDFLTGLPAIALLKRAVGDLELVLAAPAVFEPLIPLVASVDRLAPSGELQPLDASLSSVEIAVDLHGNGPASRRVLTALSPARLVGFGDPRDGFVGPVWRRDEHEVQRWCRMVIEAFGLVDVATPGVAGAVEVPAIGVPGGVTIIHPGAAARSRRWPAERFAEVARQLGRTGHRVVVTGGGQEEELARGVAEASGARVVLGLSLVELFALVAAAELVISGDTGMAHVASNYRTPSVVLFGPVSPAMWGPPPDGRHAVLFHGDGTGDPHGDQPDPALLQVSVEEVLDGARRATRAEGESQR